MIDQKKCCLGENKWLLSKISNLFQI